MIAFKETVYMAAGETQEYSHNIESIPKLVKGLSKLMPELTNETFYELAKAKQTFVTFGGHRRKWEIVRELEAVESSESVEETKTPEALPFDGGEHSLEACGRD